MARRKRVAPKFKYINPNISEVDSYQLSPRVKLQPGDNIKVKGEQGTFTFDALVTNSELNVQWINCKDKDQKRRAFRPERVVKRVKSATSRRTNKAS